jgi:AcrR family transcriptional regulator
LADKVDIEAGRPTTRQKILQAAYELFASQGAKSVGVDTICARSGVAKMTLYHYFDSKEALVLAFLDLRAKRWTGRWLKAEVKARSEQPRDRLLAIFDLFHEWFQAEDFEGCPFLKILCESPIGSTLHKGAVHQLKNILKYIAELARNADFRNPRDLAQAWMMLMKGSILTAQGGERDAALKAKAAAEMLLASWPTTRNSPPRKRASSK